MSNEGLKNIVLLKDFPSNIIEEAIIVLKENKKIHKSQKIIDKNNKKQENAEKIKKVEMHNNMLEKNIKNAKYKENDYILKEAYMFLEDYEKSLEKETPKWKNNLKRLEKRYKYSVRLNIILLVTITLGVIATCINLF